MIFNAAKKIAHHFASKNYIPEEDHEVIAYGLFLALSRFLYAVESVIFGLIFGCVKESLIFFAAFLFIRKYAGGAHAKTEQRCIVWSSLSILCAVFFLFLLDKNVPESYMILVNGVFIIAAILVFVLCPVENEKKVIDKKDKTKFKVKASVRTGILIILVYISYKLKLPTIGIAIEEAIILVSLLLVIGISMKKRKKTNQD